MDISTAVLKFELFDKDRQPFHYNFDNAYAEGRIYVFGKIASTSHGIEPRYLGENRFSLGACTSYNDLIWSDWRFEDVVSAILLLHSDIAFVTLKLLDCNEDNDWFSIQEYELEMENWTRKETRASHHGLEEIAHILGIEVDDADGFPVDVTRIFLSRPWETYEWLLQPSEMKEWR
jgi:hypothetical protein